MTREQLTLERTSGKAFQGVLVPQAGWGEGLPRQDPIVQRRGGRGRRAGPGCGGETVSLCNQVGDCWPLVGPGGSTVEKEGGLEGVGGGKGAEAHQNEGQGAVRAPCPLTTAEARAWDGASPTLTPRQPATPAWASSEQRLAPPV